MKTFDNSVRKQMNLESPVLTKQAATELGCSSTYMAAVKNAMGLRYARFVFVSQIKQWLFKNPGFRIRDVYSPAAAAPKRRSTPLNRASEASGTCGAQS